MTSVKCIRPGVWALATINRFATATEVETRARAWVYPAALPRD
jgi:hypothetical protein